MARARPTPPERWTVDEFLAWEREQEEPYEYVDGVIRMMVGGTIDHSTIIGNVYSALRAQLKGGPCRVLAASVKVSSGTATMYPDVVVTCTPVSGRSDVIPEPAIVVEVLSRSTQGFDRGPKQDAYQQISSLKQYVLVAQEEIRVSIFERDGDAWRYHTVQSPGARLTFAVADATISLAEIYEDTSVAAQAAQSAS